jgi:4'-phosphopantetheinyl transferase
MIQLNDFLWLPGPMNPDLKKDEVHVWSVSVAAAPSQIERLLGSLSSDEISQARRFHFQKDRQRFMWCRALLRLILGHYLDLEPGELVLRYNPYGKLYLMHIPGRIRLNFNLSHSNLLALFAITRDREVGIDVEHIRRDFPWEEMVDHFLPREESEALYALPKALQCETFLRRWTGKEAYLKARGVGISLPMDQIETSSVPGYQGNFLRVKDHFQESKDWTLVELTPAIGYIAALVVQGKNWRPACWHYSESML